MFRKTFNLKFYALKNVYKDPKIFPDYKHTHDRKLSGTKNVSSTQHEFVISFFVPPIRFDRGDL